TLRCACPSVAVLLVFWFCVVTVGGCSYRCDSMARLFSFLIVVLILGSLRVFSVLGRLVFIATTIPSCTGLSPTTTLSSSLIWFTAFYRLIFNNDAAASTVFTGM